MKKKKPKTKLTEKLLEKNWDSLVPASNEQVELVLMRNARTRSQKIAKDGKINIRIPKPDLDLFLALANKKGVGYQTFLQSFIRMYVTGQLVDIEEVRKVFKVS